MSLVQQQWFFARYPLIAARLTWAGTVSLDNINFRKKHIAAIAMILDNTANEDDTIDVMYIDNNNIDRKGGQLIAQVLGSNKFLRCLWLDDNAIHVKGAKAIAEALKVNKTLRRLYLNGNSIGDEGAIAIASSLRVNSTLQELGLERNGIGGVGIEMLCNALKENKSLQKLWLKGNDRVPAFSENLKDRIISDYSVTPPANSARNTPRSHKDFKTRVKSDTRRDPGASEIGTPDDTKGL